MIRKIKLFDKELIRFYRKSAKNNITIPSDLEEIIIGLILGDLHAEKISLRSNTRLKFKQSYKKKNKDYIDHLYSLFELYCGSKPKAMSYFDSRPSKNKIYNSRRFSTLSLPCFNKFRELFYNSSNIKFIPCNLDKLLTAKDLSYWLMDDGYKSGKGFYICTDSYSLEDHKILVNVLKTNFNLECGIHTYTNGYRLYVFSSSKDQLLKIVKPHIIPHFQYKFN
jgi:hypothetical protein